MKAKIISIALLLVALIVQPALGQEPTTIPSHLDEATVFFQGAELSHSATASLARGENEIRIEGLSPHIDINSLKIKTTNNVIVSAYEYSIDYLSSAKALAPALKKWQDSIAFYREALNRVEIDLKINTNLIGYLQAGVSKNVSGSEQGLPVDELMKTMEYYQTKSREMENTQTALLRKQETLTASIQRLQAQLNQESVKGNKTSGVLKLNLSAPAATRSDLVISYYTAAAGWAPYYDIQIASTDRPIVITGRSKVRQTTGLDWERIKLTLSTSTPSNGKIAPLFSAWFLQQIQYAARNSARRDLMLQNAYTYADVAVEEESLAAPAYGITVRGDATAQESGEPLIVINGEISTQEELNALDPSSIKEMNLLQGADAALYGARGANGVMVVTLKSSMDDYVTASDNSLNAIYRIELPYTIPGNGKEQNIDLMNRETSAEYNYYAAPKLDTETYLLAEISDWEKLGLLSGKANITYDGTYVGETYIDASSTHAKLSLTLGTDPRVSVKREKMTDFSTTKFLGSDVQQIFTYRITVKNNQNRPVDVVIKEQYPLSTQKNIEVALLKETTPWSANKEDIGVITWEESFAPGETKTYRISYSVKYPKGMNLNL